MTAAVSSVRCDRLGIDHGEATNLGINRL